MCCVFPYACDSSGTEIGRLTQFKRKVPTVLLVPMSSIQQDEHKQRASHATCSALTHATAALLSLSSFVFVCAVPSGTSLASSVFTNRRRSVDLHLRTDSLTMAQPAQHFPGVTAAAPAAFPVAATETDLERQLLHAMMYPPDGSLKNPRLLWLAAFDKAAKDPTNLAAPTPQRMLHQLQSHTYVSQQQVAEATGLTRMRKLLGVVVLTHINQREAADRDADLSTRFNTAVQSLQSDSWQLRNYFLILNWHQEWSWLLKLVWPVGRAYAGDSLVGKQMLVAAFYTDHADGEKLHSVLTAAARQHPDVTFANVQWSCLTLEQQQQLLVPDAAAQVRLDSPTSKIPLFHLMWRGATLPLTNSIQGKLRMSLLGTPASTQELCDVIRQHLGPGATASGAPDDLQRAVSRAEEDAQRSEETMMAVMQQHTAAAAHGMYGAHADGRIRHGLAFIIGASKSSRPQWCPPCPTAAVLSLAMTQLLRAMHFDVITLQNPTKKWLLQQLSWAAQKGVGNSRDGLLILYTGHGVHGHVAADDELVALSELCALFDAEPAWKNKPKVFIADACRGAPEGCSVDQLRPEPVAPDWIRLFSSVPGMPTWDDSNVRSFSGMSSFGFFLYTFLKTATKKDEFAAIAQRLACALAEMDMGPDKGQTQRQICSVESTLRKKLRLFIDRW